MFNFLQNGRNAVLVGAGLAVLLIWAFVASSSGFNDSRFWQAILRWAHTGAGITWIGLLVQRNLTLVPVRVVPDAANPAISLLFRWSAGATLVTGLLLALSCGYLIQVLTLGATVHFVNPRDWLLGAGLWLAIGMAASVWLVIWPAEKVLDGLITADSASVTLAARHQFLAYRINLILTLPMLVAMTASQTLFGA